MAHAGYLEMAVGAMSRRDYLSAMQFGLRAAGAPRDQQSLRCDAQLLLALIAVELSAPEEALAYAVGAHLTASHARDGEREERAEQVLGMVVTHFPQLADQMLHTFH
ncbi:MAG TPA: hypothetical protein VD902_18755 [Symbiobacteriaceae bacterium]|nr:hypothetical protein [Symbiobacteriaceae bacterium]